jgi:hypothetical protein
LEHLKNYAKSSNPPKKVYGPLECNNDGSTSLFFLFPPILFLFALQISRVLLFLSLCSNLKNKSIIYN